MWLKATALRNLFGVKSDWKTLLGDLPQGFVGKYGTPCIHQNPVISSRISFIFPVENRVQRPFWGLPSTPSANLPGQTVLS